jgi:thiamine biosynthesis lipoprotein
MSYQLFHSAFRALGTDINIQIVARNSGDKSKIEDAFSGIKKLYKKKQEIFDRFDPESEIINLNKNLGAFQNVSADMLYLTKRALYYNKISQGLYDPRIIEILEKIGYDSDFRKKDFSKNEITNRFKAIGDELEKDLRVKDRKICFSRRMDFSGIAKGYITDLAAKFLKKNGWKDFLIDSGGDIFAAGKNADGEKWRIEIEGISKEKLMLEITERGIATSGISRKKWEIGGKKFHHLVNPKNPNKFSYEIRTVSVIEKNTENADGRAKVLVLLGKEKGMEFAKKNKIAAIFLDYKGNINISPEARKFLNIQC